jgi:hypothetical protein
MARVTVRCWLGHGLRDQLIERRPHGEMLASPFHYVERVILWINGTFGVGKTTTANLIVQRAPVWRLFDPEWVGYMLRANLGDRDFADFQELPPWRALVPRVAYEIAALTGDGLLAVQTVLVEEYWERASPWIRRTPPRGVPRAP